MTPKRKEAPTSDLLQEKGRLIRRFYQARDDGRYALARTTERSLKAIQRELDRREAEEEQAPC